VDNPRFTLDTNLLVYSVDSRGDGRHDLALELVNRAPDVDCWLTLQSLSEFYVVVTRKRMMPSAEAAAQAQDWLRIFPSVPASENAVLTALADAVAGRASYWDALLVATAAEAGCTLILSEDMADGARLSGVEIHNPFTRSGALTPLARRLLEL
jgi:predicted nucleic acid-binding protein